ncbi:MAG: ribosome assembly cofactor RimP [Bacteroidales bacterium]|nr:ribosome assembly cofactor RimP [Bacteroidales bacterium]
MITAEEICILIEKDLLEKGFFLVDVQVKSSGKIFVYADSFNGITLDECAAVSRLIEGKLDRNTWNFELVVSSPGLENPLKLPVQYQKNKGRTLRVIQTDGLTQEGRIIEADAEKVILEIPTKKKQIGEKGAKQLQSVEIFYPSIKKAKLLIR